MQIMLLANAIGAATFPTDWDMCADGVHWQPRMHRILTGLIVNKVKELTAEKARRNTSFGSAPSLIPAPPVITSRPNYIAKPHAKPSKSSNHFAPAHRLPISAPKAKDITIPDNLPPKRRKLQKKVTKFKQDILKTHTQTVPVSTAAKNDDTIELSSDEDDEEEEDEEGEEVCLHSNTSLCSHHYAQHMCTGRTDS